MPKVVLSYKLYSRIVEYSNEINLQHHKERFAKSITLMKWETVCKNIVVSDYQPVYRQCLGKCRKIDDLIIDTF